LFFGCHGEEDSARSTCGRWRAELSR
jgi:hypothetical protein